MHPAKLPRCSRVGACALDKRFFGYVEQVVGYATAEHTEAEAKQEVKGLQGSNVAGPVEREADERAYHQQSQVNHSAGSGCRDKREHVSEAIIPNAKSRPPEKLIHNRCSTETAVPRNKQNFEKFGNQLAESRSQ